jgi:hypothetical protein
MSLLPYILAQLDEELARLQVLRDIVASLSRTPALFPRLVEPAARAEPAAPAPQPLQTTRATAGRPRGPRVLKRPVTPRALAAAVPTGPVVVNPSRLVQERDRPIESREEDTTPAASSEEDLDAISRNLAARWIPGAA